MPQSNKQTTSFINRLIVFFALACLAIAHSSHAEDQLYNGAVFIGYSSNYNSHEAIKGNVTSISLGFDWKKFALELGTSAGEIENELEPETKGEKLYTSDKIMFGLNMYLRKDRLMNDSFFSPHPFLVLQAFQDKMTDINRQVITSELLEGEETVVRYGYYSGLGVEFSLFKYFRIKSLVKYTFESNKELGGAEVNFFGGNIIWESRLEFIIPFSEREKPRPTSCPALKIPRFCVGR